MEPEALNGKMVYTGWKGIVSKIWNNGIHRIEEVFEQNGIMVPKLGKEMGSIDGILVFTGWNGIGSAEYNNNIHRMEWN